MYMCMCVSLGLSVLVCVSGCVARCSFMHCTAVGGSLQTDAPWLSVVDIVSSSVQQGFSRSLVSVARPCSFIQIVFLLPQLGFGFLLKWMLQNNWC